MTGGLEKSLNCCSARDDRLSVSGSEKERVMQKNDDTVIKKRKIHEKSTEEIYSSTKSIYQPIASLSSIEFCPRIRGKLVSVSKWYTTSFGTRCSNFVLEDSSGQIDGVIYRENNLEFENQFKAGAILIIKNAWVKPVRAKFREQSKSNYELGISETLKTIEIRKQNGVQPETSDVDSRILIKDLVEKTEAQQLVDVIGVIIAIEDVKKNSRNGREIIMRDIRLIDESSMNIVATMWHDRAKNFNSSVGTVVAIYQVAVRVHGEQRVKSLTFNKSSRLKIDPATEASQRLKNWYKQWKLENDRSLQEYTENITVAKNSYTEKNSRSRENLTKSPVIFDTPSLQSFIPSSQLLRHKSMSRSNDEQEMAELKIEKISNVQPQVSGENSHNLVEYSSTCEKSCYTKISVIKESIPAGEIIDVLGIIVDRMKLQNTRCLNGAKIKLMVHLCDETGEKIWMTIWGAQANKIDPRKYLIVAAKKVQVRCWKDQKEITCTDRTSNLIIEPEIEETKELRKWLEAHMTKKLKQKTRLTASLTSIENLKNGETSSILGIVTQKDEPKIIGVKYPLDIARMIEIIDESGKTIRIALWGEQARDFNIAEGSIIFVANVKIYTSNKINGAFTPTSYFKVEPSELRENIERLKDWFARFKRENNADFDKGLVHSVNYSQPEIDDSDQ